jgi:hypothetical protein
MVRAVESARPEIGARAANALAKGFIFIAISLIGHVASR